MRAVQEMDGGTAVSAAALLDTIILQAQAADASDVHILPELGHTSIRFRIDGQLSERYRLPSAIHAELIARVKILSGIRTDEQYLPHDGRFTFGAEQPIDIRVATAPAHHGEKSTLRLLSSDIGTADLEALGFGPECRDLAEAALKRSHGMILVSGPTGSGKTTTLYSLLTACSARGQSVVTIEDPIERPLDGISQMQVNPLRGFTFAHGLRSILRQDPDVIMVGEIRDAETAQLACSAALTGHLVFSSLHASDTATALVRLRDLGIEPYLLEAGVSLIVAQRLVRRVCARCSARSPISATQYESMHSLCERYGIVLPAALESVRGQGCEHCDGSGYRGRIGTYEVRSEGAPPQMTPPLMHDALSKAIAGSTSLDEVMRLGARYV
jgi:type II secretory ATPase GspE/PulE/Tfp pilus assembly ATPase PilB-like protein